MISCAEKTLEQKYDILIIATGSRAMRDDLPWKSSMEGYEATKANLDKLREQIKKAKSIVVGGAGK
jgi:NAD(P)H-nitrite reductase large subunit